MRKNIYLQRLTSTTMDVYCCNIDTQNINQDLVLNYFEVRLCQECKETCDLHFDHLSTRLNGINYIINSCLFCTNKLKCMIMRKNKIK